MTISNLEKVKELVERVKLTNAEMQTIRNELIRYVSLDSVTGTVALCCDIAKAQLNKVLNDPDLALIEYYYYKDPDEDTGVRRMRVIPLAEAIKEC